jgi:hypothetical protein
VAEKRKRVLWRALVSLAIAIAFAWLLVRGGLPIVPSGDAFARVKPWTVPVYALLLVAVHFFRAVRWRHLLRPLGNVSTRNVLSTAWIGFAAVLFLPLRAGEVVRPMLVTKRGTVRGWEAAGSVAGERIIDGLILSIVLFATLQLTTPLDPLPERIGELELAVSAVPGAAYAALAVFSAAFIAMGLFHFRRAWGIAITRAMLGWISAKLAERVATIVGRIADGLGFLPSARSLAPFLLETGAYWGINALGFYVLAQGCGLESIGVLEACVVMGCLGFGILVPSGPGFFGTFQLSMYLALALFVDAQDVTMAGGAFVFIAYCGVLLQHLVFAIVGWLLAKKLPDTELLT